MNVGPGITAEFPGLTDEQVASVARRGTRHHTTAGEVLYAAGDRGYDFIVIEAGEVDILRPAMPNAPEALIATWGPGRFLGELNLLTGQSAIATARVRTPGVVHRIAPTQFRELMAADAEVSDLVLRVLLARRQSLRLGEGARTLEILGSQLSPATHALRTWASRQELPHTWLDVDDPRGQALANAADIGVDEASGQRRRGGRKRDPIGAPRAGAGRMTPGHRGVWMAEVREINPEVPPSGTGCAQCLAADPTGWWFHLRRCAQCGHIGCCDSSPSQHARAHFYATDHRYMQSFEPGEDWFWDFETDEYAAGPQLVPPLHHPEDQPAPGPAGAVPQDWVQRLHR